MRPELVRTCAVLVLVLWGAVESAAAQQSPAAESQQRRGYVQAGQLWRSHDQDERATPQPVLRPTAGRQLARSESV
jgi:hypothetical protein